MAAEMYAQDPAMMAGFQQAAAGAPLDASLGLERVFPCVRLRGLPFDVTGEVSVLHCMPRLLVASELGELSQL